MAQKILSERAGRNEDKRTIAMQNQGKALLSGNIFCGHCGCRLATTQYKESYTRRDGTLHEEEKIQSAYRKAISTNHQMQKKLETELGKYRKQLDALRMEISKVLAGDSIFTQEDLTQSLQTLKADIAEHEGKLAQLKDEDRQKRDMAESVIPAYKQFRSWAEEYEDASFEAKKMIANRLFSRVEVYKGYRLKIEVNMTYRQFLDGWEVTDGISVVA